MNEISSAQNPKFKTWLSLLESKGIRAERLALVSGSKVIEELLKQRPKDVEELLLPPKSDWTPPAKVRCTRLSSDLFKKLDVIGTRAPLAVVCAPDLEAWTPTKPQGLELVLALSDPSNLGACLRSAEAFGVSRVILTKECSSPFLPKCIRASSGSVFRVQMMTCGDLADFRANGADIVGLDMHGENLFGFAWPENLYLLLGEEGRGLPNGLCSKTLKIPMQAPVESLNATVAASVALAQFQAHRLSR